jgi:membrane protein
MYVRLWRRHQIPMRAAALTYTLILALIPLLTVCLSVFSLFIDIKKLSLEFKSFLLKNLAAGAGNVVSQTIDSFLGKVHFKALGYIGFAALLVTSLLLLSSIEDAINRIWAIRRRKQVWKRFLTYNLILLLGPVSVSLSVATTTLVTKYFPHMLFRANFGVVLVNTLFVTLTYKIFPNKKVRWGAAALSGLAVALACELAKWGYAFYVARALFYNKIYGGLAALPFFLVWIYLNWVIFLAGALLSFMLQHRKTWKLQGYPI